MKLAIIGIRQKATCFARRREEQLNAGLDANQARRNCSYVNRAERSVATGIEVLTFDTTAVSTYGQVVANHGQHKRLEHVEDTRIMPRRPSSWSLLRLPTRKKGGL